MTAPQIPGFALVWSDDFDGPTGSGPNSSNWTLQTVDNFNNEIQQYTQSTQNAQLNGQSQLLIIPLKASSNTWTSARLEGNHSFSCDPGHKLILQANILVGQNDPSQQKGVWPAFWALGASIHSGTQWPQCGEWDILEFVNGSSINQATLHYANVNGQHAQMDNTVSFTRSAFHTWTVEVDCTSSNLSQQSVTWKYDGVPWLTINGGTFTGGLAPAAAHSQWSPIANTPYFPILNVAVGGDWPGLPDDQTKDGIGSGLTVNYVAVYKSNGPNDRDEL